MRGKEQTNRDNPPTQPPSLFPSRLTTSLPAIRGLIETSFIDWPGRLCAILFLGGCNFRCPFCHNHPLVLAPESLDPLPLSEVLSRLAPMRQWLGGICVSGGEPTLSDGLAVLLEKLKEKGWPVKLDTNGSRPEVLARLIEAGLLDMVSMDVKAPLEQDKYDRCIGKTAPLDKIRQSVALLKASTIDHEFRMTVLPRFHSAGDIAAWASELGPGARLKLQNFNPRTTLDPELQQESGFPPDRFAELEGLIAPTPETPVFSTE